MISILRIYVKMAEISLDGQNSSPFVYSRFCSMILESPRQKKVNPVPALESVAADVGFSKIGTGSVTANLSLIPTIVKRKQETNFHELLTRTSSTLF